MTPLCDPASYSGEYYGIRAFLTWGDQGPFEHPTRSPARPGTAPPCLIFPGVVQFSVSVFSACRNLPLCRATGGADGHCRRSRRHPRMAPDPAGDGAEAGPLTSATPALPGRSPKPRISYSIEYASTRLKGQTVGVALALDHYMVDPIR